MGITGLLPLLKDIQVRTNTNTACVLTRVARDTCRRVPWKDLGH